MRFSVVALVAAVVAVASAQDAPLNPLYPFPAEGACVEACLVKIGKNMMPNFTRDPASPDFLASLAFAHERDTPAYKKYMGETGPCIAKCPAAEQGQYMKAYDAKAAWYYAKTGKTPTASANPNAGLPGATGTGASGAKPTGNGAVANSASALVGAVAVLSTLALL
ncbi:hypothetical protein BGZ95_008842 [Linnemannia exigua]|uniref:Uncharacterized protein n=1 Tax=Linnemannia exigua TaxID=604196 RepID=A0AAD4DDS6_9FUNG|nr:hypothetical protein BGZ95_008842 [Linnemannia exigua]